MLPPNTTGKSTAPQKTGESIANHSSSLSKTPNFQSIVPSNLSKPDTLARRVKAEPAPGGEKVAKIASGLSSKEELDTKRDLNWTEELISWFSEKVINLKKVDNVEDLDATSRSRLQAATGNPILGLVITSASPKLTQILSEKLLPEENDTSFFSNLQRGVSDAISKEPVITESLNSTLLNMMANLAENTKDYLKSPQVSFPDMIGRILSVAESHMLALDAVMKPNFAQEFEELSKIGDDKLRKEKLKEKSKKLSVKYKEVLTPFKTDLLKILMPKGLDDIIVSKGIKWAFQTLLYNKINNALPNLLIEYYYEVMAPTLDRREKDTVALEKMPGGNVLNDIADLIAKKLPKKLPTLISENIGTIVAELKDNLFVAETNPNEKDRNSIWLGNGISQLINSTNPEVTQLWEFGEYYLSPVVRYILLNLAQNTRTADSTNVLSDISNRLFDSATSFFKTNNPNIQKAILEYKEAIKGAVSEEDKVSCQKKVYKLFKPLSKEFITLAGLDKPDQMPIPNFLRNVIANAIKTQLPMRMYHLYQDMYVATDPQDFQEAKFSQFAGIMISNFIPKFLEKSEESVSVLEFIARKINEGLAKDESNEVKQKYIDNTLLGIMERLESDKAGSFIKDQAQNILTKILMKVAAYGRPEERLVVEDASTFDLLPNLLSNLVDMSKKHLQNFDKQLLKRIVDFSNLSGDVQKEERSLLVEKFVPFAKELLEMAGYTDEKNIPGPRQAKAMTYELLKDNVIPGFIFDTLRGLEKVKMDQASIRKNLGQDNLITLEVAADGIADFITQKIDGKLLDKKNGLMRDVDNALGVKKLPTDQQKWLEQEFYKIGKTQSSKIAKAKDFVKEYSRDIVFNILGQLALQYKAEHLADTRTEQDILKLAILQIFSHISNKGMDLLSHKLITELRDARILAPDQKKKKLKDLVIHFKPFILNMLKGAGLKGPQDLAVPATFQETVWKMLSETTLPNALMSYMSDMAAFQSVTPIENDELINVDRLRSVISKLAENAVPLAQSIISKKIENADGSILPGNDVKLFNTVNKLLPNVISLSTMQSLINEFVDSKDVGVKEFASKVPQILSDFITPIILNLSSSIYEGDVLEGAISNFLTIITESFKGRWQSFDVALKGYENLSTEDQQLKLNEVFGDIVSEFLNHAGIQVELIPATGRHLILSKTYDLYKMFKTPLEIQQNCRLELFKISGVNVGKLHEQLDEFSNELQNMTMMENITGFAAEKINQEVINYIANEPGKLIRFMDKILPKEQLSITNQKWLQKVLSELVQSEDPTIKDIRSYSEDVLKTSLMKIFVDVANQSSQAKDPSVPQKQIIPVIIARISTTLGTNLEDIQSKIKQIHSEHKSLDSRKQEMRKLFKPLASDFLKMAGPNPLEVLPLPAGIRESILHEIQENLLPDILGEMYLDLASWELKSHKDKLVLKDLFGNDNPSAAAKVIARFARDFIPVYLDNPDKKVSNKLHELINTFVCKQSGKSAELIQKYLNDHPNDVIAFIQENMNQLLDSGQVMDNALPAAQDLIEASVQKLMSRVFEKMNENQNPNFLIDLGFDILKLANQHFTELNRIMRKEGENLAYKVDSEVMHDQYAYYHPAFEKHPAGEEFMMKEKFFKPVTEKLLKFAGIENADDLPFPASLREKLFGLLKDELGPMLIKEVMDSIDINKASLAILETLNKSMENSGPIEDDIDQFLSEDEKAKQNEMDTVCGELFLNVITLIPNTATGAAVQTFFMFKKIQQLTASSIGRSIRKQLGNTLLLQNINKGFIAGLTSLNKQIKIDEKGNLVLPDDFHFDLPKTPEERALKENENLKIEAEVREKLIRELTKTLRDQIAFRLKQFFRGPWRSAQARLDKWIDAKFGKLGNKIKKFLDTIFHAIIFSCLGSICQLAVFPFFRLLGFILNIHYRKKSLEITKTLRMKIHKNLLFSAVDQVLNAFLEKQKASLAVRPIISSSDQLG